MALYRDTRYPGRWASRTINSPQGAFKNKSAPSATDGSYAEQDWLNDWDGFFGRLLTMSGITPNGNVDNASSSQYYDALLKMFPLLSNFTASLQSTGYFQIPFTSDAGTINLIVNWSDWSGVTGTVASKNGIYETSPAVIATPWKKPFTTSVLCIIPSTSDTNVAQQESARYVSGNLTGCRIFASCDTPSCALNGKVLAIGY